MTHSFSRRIQLFNHINAIISVVERKQKLNNICFEISRAVVDDIFSRIFLYIHSKLTIMENRLIANDEKFVSLMTVLNETGEFFVA